MSENNYGAMMIKSAVGVSDDINEILSPGIYLIPPANTSSPDSGGGALIIHSGSPIRRTFTSDSVICLTSTRNGNAWTGWRGPLSRKNPFGDIKTDGAAAIAKSLENLGLDTALAAKQPLDATLTGLSGKDDAGLRAYLSLKSAATRDV
ncbi:pyocin knob domain-containing protein, partial [Citrobacter portucalensis]|uniref:pyocin knob domain-containing protein n=2 Tax=Citrobacter portucalensis TaxID=1639133 RepID=UPI00226B68A2